MIATAGLLAVGFVNLALLGGAGLVAAPIIIHWLAKRRYKRVSWAAVRFLLDAERENRRRMRMEQWLLLALRCLAMLLLALMVARPFFQPGLMATIFGSPGRVQRIVVIDDSASMQYRNGVTTDFDDLKDAADRLASWISQESDGDSLTIYVTSKPETPAFEVSRFTVADLASVQTFIEAISPSVVRANPLAVMTQVADSIESMSQFDRVDLYVLSDFQQADWVEGSGSEGVFSTLQSVPKDRLRIVLLEGERKLRPNVAIESVTLDRSQVVAGQPASLKVAVHNYGDERLEGGALSMEIGDHVMPDIMLDPLAPKSAVEIEHEITIPDSGYAVVKVNLTQGDRFSLDDSGAVVVGVKSSISVLLVNGQPAADATRDEVHLLRRALAPPGPFPSGMSVSVIDPEELEGTPLDIYDAVFLCNVGFVTDGANNVLQHYVRNGGGLGIFLGSAIQDQTTYNRVLYNNGQGLLPAALDGVVDAGRDQVGLVGVADHPVCSAFPGESDALSEYVGFRQYVRTRVPMTMTVAEHPDDASELKTQVLARFADAERTPAILEKQFGHGRVMLFTSSIDLDWNNWAGAVDGSYVVTMLEMAHYLARHELHPSAFSTGQPMSIPVFLERYESDVVARSPRYPAVGLIKGKITADGVVGNGTLGTAQLGVAEEVGLYSVELKPRSGPVEARPVCVNLDRRESDLAIASQAQLATTLGEIPHVFADRADAFGDETQQTRHELWRLLLFAIVGVLMIEQFVGWWFGRIDHGKPTTRGEGGRR